MAEENENGEEKTEEPSEKRLADSREKGQVARSRELATVAVFGSAVLLLAALGGSIAHDAGIWMRSALSFDRQLLDDTAALPMHFVMLLTNLLFIAAPLVLACLLAAFIAPAVMGGFQFSVEALKPDLGKLNPLAGLKRIYGREGMAELVKSLLRVLLITGLGTVGILFAAPRLMALMHEPLGNGVVDGLWLVMRTLALMTLGLVLLAAIDAPYQLWSHRKKLMMTRQELRDELKETEGRPELKSRIRRLQYDMANRRMMEDVPRADVILVNPTHYAIALKYDAGRMRAPTVLAKGVDEIARIIRESGERHGVPVVSAPPLARALYRNVEIGREIPANLYAAVAQVLGYVYQMRNWRRHGGRMPDMPPIDLPDAEG